MAFSVPLRQLFGIIPLCAAVSATPAQNVRNFSPIPAPNAGKNAAAVQNAVKPNVPTIVFDADSKEYDSRPGEATAPFTFSLTNIWTNEIRIDRVQGSCGCTTAELPQTPWHIPPGSSGKVRASVNLAGKSGLLVKTLTFYTSVGELIVTVKVKMPPPGTGLAMMTEAERQAAAMLASANPQAIFRADCAQCHVEKGARAMGQDLYGADCGICHESPHRASAVPDLHALKHPTDLEFWRTVIRFGKPHTMMPGFGRSQGGPLSDEQIASLAAYLNRTISHDFGLEQPANAATQKSAHF